MVIIEGRNNVHCKTFLYHVIEMTLLWNLLFIMFKRNDLITKLFLALYLVIIYVYTFLYHKYAHTQGVCIFIFVFYLLFLVLTMTASLCFFPILRFNKALLLYMLSTPCVNLMNRIRLCYRIVSWMDLQIDICMYIYIVERDNLVV